MRRGCARRLSADGGNARYCQREVDRAAAPATRAVDRERHSVRVSKKRIRKRTARYAVNGGAERADERRPAHAVGLRAGELRQL